MRQGKGDSEGGRAGSEGRRKRGKGKKEEERGGRERGETEKRTKKRKGGEDDREGGGEEEKPTGKTRRQDKTGRRQETTRGRHRDGRNGGGTKNREEGGKRTAEGKEDRGRRRETEREARGGEERGKVHVGTSACVGDMSGCSMSVLTFWAYALMLLFTLADSWLTWSVCINTRVHVGGFMYFVLYNPRGSLQSSTLENVRGRRRGAERVHGRDEFGQRERRTGERKTENEAEKGERDCWRRGQAGKGGEGEKEQQRERLYMECNGPGLDQQDRLRFKAIGFTARFSCMARR